MNQEGCSVAIVGVTGEVGRQMLKVLERYPIPLSSLRLLASSRSIGKKFCFREEELTVEELKEDSFANVELALFSAGKEVSLKYVPLALDQGAVVIDNTSAFRMDDNIPLVVPEVNAYILSKETKLIANPNCSTIQLVVALKSLVNKYGVESVNVSTYQAISGAGAKALNEYEQELQDKVHIPAVLPTSSDQKFYHIAHNVIPQIDTFTESGYTKEELKMINETRKILNDQSLRMNATCVRVPVRYGHSISTTVKLKEKIKNRNEILELFSQSSDINLYDSIQEQLYPMPAYLANQDDVYVGRIRKDLFEDDMIHFWIVADNLLKGAALNSVQIAYYLYQHGWLGD